jgi:AmiR/NasT family two-component response regulator
VALAQERLARRSERLAERIQQILNERGRVEQVKGMLAAHMDISPLDAYEVLAHHARTQGTTVVQAAAELIDERVDAATVIADWWERDTAAE